MSGGLTAYLGGGSWGEVAAATAIGALGGATAGFTLGVAGSILVERLPELLQVLPASGC